MLSQYTLCALFDALDLSLNLRYQIQKELMMQEVYQQQDRERMIREICDEVMKRISVKVETEAVSQLSGAIKNLGR